MSHPLETPWTLYYQRADPDSADYSQSIHKIGKFDTVEDFWAVFSHLKRPSDISLPIEYQIFRHDIRGMWEDEVNCHGGKWILFLKKNYSSQYWEKTVISLIGEMIHEDVVGAVLALRDGADFLSFWTREGRTGTNDHVINDIASSVSKALELPVGTRLKFKNHNEPSRDASKPPLSFSVKGQQQTSRRPQKAQKPPPKSG
jgi:translation initiation factor 4E